MGIWDRELCSGGPLSLFTLPWTSKGRDALGHLDEVVVEVVAPQGSVVNVAVAADAESELLVAAVFCRKLRTFLWHELFLCDVK